MVDVYRRFGGTNLGSSFTGTKTCSINPVNATVAWMSKANAVSFEMRSPTLTCSGTVTGCVDFYIGAVLIGQAHVKMNVVRSSASAEEPDVLGPAAKVRTWTWSSWTSSNYDISTEQVILHGPTTFSFNRRPTTQTHPFKNV